MTKPQKNTINLGAVDLEEIDELIEQGFFSNRADFIRTSIQSQLYKHENNPQLTVTRKKYGTRHSDL